MTGSARWSLLAREASPQTGESLYVGAGPMRGEDRV